MCKTVVEDTWAKIFVGGLPCHFSDEQVKELLAPFGALKSFNLVMDKTTGKSKVRCWCCALLVLRLRARERAWCTATCARQRGGGRAVPEYDTVPAAT